MPFKFSEKIFKMQRKAKSHLFKDPIFKKAMSGLKPLSLPRSGNVYNELVKNIVYQQISYKAADNIFGRLVDLLGSEKYKPKDILKQDHDTLRSVGLSNQKAMYVKNISTFFIEKKLYKKDWSKSTDREIVDLLTEIKGVGTWTVHMILLFELMRPDVFPVKDLAIQQSMNTLYNINKEKKALFLEMNNIAENWKPYRSIATLYLWSWKRANS